MQTHQVTIIPFKMVDFIVYGSIKEIKNDVYTEGF